MGAVRCPGMQRSLLAFVLTAGIAAQLAAAQPASAPVTAQSATGKTSDGAWPAPVPGWVAVKPDEHPRLFFRKSDLPELKRRAATSEGKLIVERLKLLLGGGTTLQPVAKGGKELTHAVAGPLGAWTAWHAAGYGMLYQLTGDQAYADLGRKATEWCFEGANDPPAYSWNKPDSYLRAGPVVGAVAMGYDLCFDGWDPAFRQSVAQKLLAYRAKASKYMVDMEGICKGGNHGPESNHHGSCLGGGGLAMLAIRGDAGVDQAQVERNLGHVERAMVNLFRKGMGETGYFFEHPGPGQIASDTSLVPMIQAYRVAAGKDYAVRGGPLWLALRWSAWLMPNAAGGASFAHPSPTTAGYGTEDFTRYGLTRGGQFVQGFGLVTDPALRGAMLWTYRTVVEPKEQAEYGSKFGFGGKPSWDAFAHPHRAVLALVNWPIGEQPRNPEGIIPKSAGDPLMGYYYFRNRWKDADDVFVGVLLGARNDKQMTSCVWGLGGRWTFGSFTVGQPATHYQAYPDGSGTLSQGASALAVDYSGASGADAVIVLCGPAANGAVAGMNSNKWVASAKKATAATGGAMQATEVVAGGTTFAVLVLGGKGAKLPTPVADGAGLKVGGQGFTLESGRIVMAKAGTPARN